MQINEQQKEKFKQVANLPTLPKVASHLIRMINDPLTSSSDVAFLIGQDLSLSAKVLRLANSAYYGIPRKITSINNAVVLLGFKVINTIVLSLTVFDLFPEKKRISALFNRQAFWLHSLSCGLICKNLSGRIKSLLPFDPEEAFCAGLLHDIGKVVLEQYVHEDFHKALQLAADEEIPVFEAEMRVLGYTHTDVAEWLTENWGLPLEIQFPLIYHHSTPQSSDFHNIVALCHISDWLCYECGMGVGGQFKAPQVEESCFELLRIREEDIEEIKRFLPEEVEKTSIFFELGT